MWPKPASASAGGNQPASSKSTQTTPSSTWAARTDRAAQLLRSQLFGNREAKQTRRRNSRTRFQLEFAQEYRRSYRKRAVECRRQASVNIIQNGYL